MLSRKQIDFADRLKADQTGGIASIDAAIRRNEVELERLLAARATLVDEAEVIDTVLMPAIQDSRASLGTRGL